MVKSFQIFLCKLFVSTSLLYFTLMAPTSGKKAESTQKGGGTTATLPSEVSIHDDIDNLSISEATKKYFPVMIAELRKISGLYDEIKSLKETVSNLIKENNESKNTIKELKTELLKKDEIMEHILDDANARERHSRSFNVRIIANIQEQRFEDTEMIVEKIFEKSGVLKQHPRGSIDISIAHRVGPHVENSCRPILVRLTRKRDVWFLLSKKNQFREKGYGVFADLTVRDLKEKRKYQAVVNALYQKGVRSKFENGFWIVRGKKLNIKDHPEFTHLVEN